MSLITVFEQDVNKLLSKVDAFKIRLSRSIVNVLRSFHKNMKWVTMISNVVLLHKT